ncbi:molybdopterin-dependent oxidoreductase [Methanolobus profundi]|uniref:Oxidoreductase molybdopterin binding domain-containing protein n=1 Tax=Methanolobus profundi TaxID=487685 RepID=A0A1I4NYB1_9EURY|nr:molybdopterin-dependent oxidoreductase [Methanolobus profundi]SFM20564.1 Oxidoreductase molybdopterin binding domain-containing protein [Methanolobus profundi]
MFHKEKEMTMLIRVSSILLFLILISGCTEEPQVIVNTSNEATVFEGKTLTPIEEQRNNGIEGTQYIDEDTYELYIYGEVDEPVRLSYDELLAYPSVSRFVRLDCVEGWGFDAKWTGVTLNTLFNETGLSNNATTVIFYCEDGYTTSLELDYLVENDIMLAYELNDITLPADRGFPLQLVAEDKYGYKWAKWITSIEVTDEPYKGYWETAGYSNSADVGGSAFEN